jgi:hypothetical protein
MPFDLILLALLLVGCGTVCRVAWRTSRRLGRAAVGLTRSTQPRGLGSDYERMLREKR